MACDTSFHIKFHKTRARKVFSSEALGSSVRFFLSPEKKHKQKVTYFNLKFNIFKKR